MDSYSSRGVRKVTNIEELRIAFKQAVEISRTNTAVVEEFVEGRELTIDVYVEEGEAKLLCASELDKIGDQDRFVIYRTNYPAAVPDSVIEKVKDTAQKIADAFGLMNTPMLIQLITDGQNISVVEFCARTGGGDKFRLIKKVSGFDVVKAVVDLTLGIKPHVEQINIPQKYIVDEFLYCKPGRFDHLEGFEDALEKGLISEYFQLKTKGAECGEIRSSGDRAAYFTVETNSIEELKCKHKKVNEILRIVDDSGIDIMRHDLLEGFGI